METYFSPSNIVTNGLRGQPIGNKVGHVRYHLLHYGYPRNIHLKQCGPKSSRLAGAAATTHELTIRFSSNVHNMNSLSLEA